MASEVEICNLGLAGVGISQGISALNESGSEAANQCNLVFVPCRDMVLRDYDWPFARRYETLGLVEEEPNTEWTYSYRYPSGCLAVRKIIGATRTDISRIPFSIGSDASGRLIYTDQPEAVARLTVRITDPEIFDPLFVMALAALIGARVGAPLSRDPKLVAQSQQAYLDFIASARATAENEAVQDAPAEAESIRARS